MSWYRRMALAGLAASLLGACASVAPVAPPAPFVVAPAFDAAGRLSARRGNDGVTVHFTWRHAPKRDVLDVSTPLGQVVARMTGDGSGVSVERPNEPVAGYPSWSALTQAVLGVGIPVESLAAWVQAAPAPGAWSDIERDTGGRVILLRQQGWEIVYAYSQASDARASRMTLRYPGSEPVEVRIVIDRWATPS